MFIFYLTRIVGGIGIQRGSHTSAAGLVRPGMFLEGLEISEWVELLKQDDVYIT